jgi:integrase
MLTLWQSFFKWAIGSKRYSGENPIAEIPRPKKGTARSGAEAFREDELKKIFQSHIFAGMKRPHQYWGPLLGLFTGARSNEIAQLRLCDFIENAGVRCINITHDLEGGTRTKNASSNRILPLHPVLWEIGLDDYLNDLKSLGADRLFPNLPADPKTGKREKYLSRDFNETLLAEVGVHRLRVKVFHSFRDTVADTLASANVHAAYIADWLGHAREGVTAVNYVGVYSVDVGKNIILPSLNFKLDFSKFKYERGRWNDLLKSHS